MTATPMPDSATLIYDGECAFCKRCVDWIAKRARPGALEYLPFQAPARGERFPQLTEEQCLEGMQLVLPGGDVRSGEKAVPDLLSRLKRWRWIAFVFELPGINLVAGPAYRLIVRNRYMISEFVRKKDGSDGPACGDGEGCDISK
jgi:predicted DCC family thiol-disulfide oxidoreductase YuxK